MQINLRQRKGILSPPPTGKPNVTYLYFRVKPLFRYFETGKKPMAVQATANEANCPKKRSGSIVKQKARQAVRLATLSRELPQANGRPMEIGSWAWTQAVR
jgi:hypothetical protein